eukprot:scaffold155360_cov25-Tisochrysis_lutea.AAC.6
MEGRGAARGRRGGGRLWGRWPQARESSAVVAALRMLAAWDPRDRAAGQLSDPDDVVPRVHDGRSLALSLGEDHIDELFGTRYCLNLLEVVDLRARRDARGARGLERASGCQDRARRGEWRGGWDVPPWPARRGGPRGGDAACGRGGGKRAIRGEGCTRKS